MPKNITQVLLHSYDTSLISVNLLLNNIKGNFLLSHLMLNENCQILSQIKQTQIFPFSLIIRTVILATVNRCKSLICFFSVLGRDGMQLIYLNFREKRHHNQIEVEAMRHYLLFQLTVLTLDGIYQTPSGQPFIHSKYTPHYLLCN